MDETLHDMHERLVDYLDDVSDSKGKEEVENLIASNPVWSKAFEDLQETRAAIRHFGLKQKVSAINLEMKNELTSTGGYYRRMIRPFLSVAAAFLLIIAGYYFYKFYNLSAEKVFESHYVSYDLGTLRGANVHSDELDQAFRKKDHAEVLKIYARLDTVTNKETFLAGISSLETKDYRAAKILFKNILEEKQGIGLFQDEAEFFLALACIATKDYDQALPLLKKIRSEKQHPYHQEVDENLIQNVRMLRWK